MTGNEARSAAAKAGDNVPGWPLPPNPGDLSRRLAARRAELRLSVAQVAERARVSVRYLDYLEQFPAQPSAALLRRLAAALRTTPAALLGARGDVPESGHAGQVDLLEPLTRAECRRLLSPGGIGRISFLTDAGLTILPVNYAVVAGTIVLRTATDSVLAEHAEDPVAFEAGHVDDALGRAWSVLVQGHAQRVQQPGELQNLLRDCDLGPWPAAPRDLYVRIVPEQVTGRRSPQR